MLAVKWLFEAVDRREICSWNSIFVQKFSAAFLRQNLSLRVLFLLVFVWLSGPKQSPGKQRQSGLETPCLESSFKLHFLFCFHCLYQSLSQKHCVRCWKLLLDWDKALKWALGVEEDTFVLLENNWREAQSLEHPCFLGGRLCRAVAHSGFCLFS